MEILQFVAGMPLGYYAAAALIGLGVWLWKRRRVPALLAAYAFFLLSLAVLARESAAERQYALRLFWSYADLEKQGLQILANIGVFVPLGLLLFAVIRDKPEQLGLRPYDRQRQEAEDSR